MVGAFLRAQTNTTTEGEAWRAIQVYLVHTPSLSLAKYGTLTGKERNGYEE